MARFYGVSGPIFGVACLGEASTSTLEVPSHRIIYCGGGGSSKTGVGNAIVAADLDESGLLELCKLDTGDELCSGVQVFRGCAVLVAVFGKSFRLCALVSLAPGMIAGPRESSIVVVSEDYVADFKDCDPSINCVTVLDEQAGELIATGGEDGVPRIWVVERRGGAIAACAAPRFACVLATTCGGGHGAPVTDCAFSPSGHLLATSSKDGTCKVWSVGTGALLCVANAANAMPPPPASRHIKQRRNLNANKIIVRGCKFVGDSALLSVHSASRGAAQAATWDLAPTNGDTQVLDATLRVSQRISKHPVSALCLHGDHVAVGTVEGEVAFFDADTLAPRASSQVHDLPVTALVWATAKSLPTIPPRVLSASADYKIVATPDAVASIFTPLCLSLFFAAIVALAAALFQLRLV